MRSSVIRRFNTDYSTTQQPQTYPSSYCTLQWRRGQLLVQSPRNLKQPYLAVLEEEKSLVQCLKHSPIRLVRIDPELGEEKLRLWADACEKANKPIFLHLPPANKKPSANSSPLWWLERGFQWIAALVLLLLLSPVFLGLVFVVRTYSPGCVFSREWQIGEKGKLFRAIRFRTTKETEKTPGKLDETNVPELGRWIGKLRLDSMPQWINVIRGEIPLVGSRSYTLKDALRLTLTNQQQMNTSDQITTLWQLEVNSATPILD